MSYKRLKGKARELLIANGNNFVFIISFIIAVSMGLLPLLALSFLRDAISEGTFAALFIALILFMLAPLILGVYRIAGLAYNHKEYGITDVFYAFSSVKNYFRAIFVVIIGLLKIIIAGIICIFCYAILSAVFGEVAGIKLPLMLASISVALLTLAFANRFYPLSYLICTKEMGIISAVKNSWRYTKGKTLKLTVLIVRALPVTLLSAIALMVPFMIYNFPFRISLYSVTCGELGRSYENKNIKIEIQNTICPEAIGSGVEEINEQHS